RCGHLVHLLSRIVTHSHHHTKLPKIACLYSGLMRDYKGRTEAASMGRKPSRPEVGTITQKHGAWYWRRYATNAAGERKPEWVKLCDVSDERRTKADVIDLVRERIKQEAHIDRPASGSKQIGNFVEDDFLPWVDANKRPATANGYKKIWNKHLKPHFG